MNTFVLTAINSAAHRNVMLPPSSEKCHLRRRRAGLRAEHTGPATLLKSRLYRQSG